MMIDIDHVSFQYSGAEQENLQDFNLQIKKGECVVLTGESGCGKTCVTRLINTLIPHFYEGEMSGAVLIDGVDTRTIQPHDLSDKIGSVFQNPRSQFFSLDTDSEIVFGIGQLPLGVQKEVGATALQGIRFYKEAGLTAAGTANHNNVQIPLVLIGIIAEADILGKNDFLPRVLAVAVCFGLPDTNLWYSLRLVYSL